MVAAFSTRGTRGVRATSPRKPQLNLALDTLNETCITGMCPLFGRGVRLLVAVRDTARTDRVNVGSALKRSWGERPRNGHRAARGRPACEERHHGFGRSHRGDASSGTSTATSSSTSSPARGCRNQPEPVRRDARPPHVGAGRPHRGAAAHALPGDAGQRAPVVLPFWRGARSAREVPQSRSNIASMAFRA